MKRKDIEETEWGLQLWENTTPSTYREIVKRMEIQTPVFVVWNGNHAEITLGSYTIHNTATMVEALEWCAQFELPVQAQPQGDIVPKLLEWLDAECNDDMASRSVKSVLPVVREKIYELMKEQK